MIGDDRIRLRSANGRVLAAGAPAIAGLIEVRGYGLLSMPCEISARIHIIIDILSLGDLPERMPEPHCQIAEILGVVLPRLIVPAMANVGDQAESTLTLMADVMTLRTADANLT